MLVQLLGRPLHRQQTARGWGSGDNTAASAAALSTAAVVGSGPGLELSGLPSIQAFLLLLRWARLLSIFRASAKLVIDNRRSSQPLIATHQSYNSRRLAVLLLVDITLMVVKLQHQLLLAGMISSLMNVASKLTNVGSRLMNVESFSRSCALTMLFLILTCITQFSYCKATHANIFVAM